jgi:hypothetical protein
MLFRAGGGVPGTGRHVLNQGSSSGLVVGSLDLPGMIFYQRSSSGLVVGSLELPQSVVELKLIAHKLEEIKLQLKVSQQTDKQPILGVRTKLIGSWVAPN